MKTGKRVVSEGIVFQTTGYDGKKYECTYKLVKPGKRSCSSKFIAVFTTTEPKPPEGTNPDDLPADSFWKGRFKNEPCSDGQSRIILHLANGKPVKACYVFDKIIGYQSMDKPYSFTSKERKAAEIARKKGLTWSPSKSSSHSKNNEALKIYRARIIKDGEEHVTLAELAKLASRKLSGSGRRTATSTRKETKKSPTAPMSSTLSIGRGSRKPKPKPTKPKPKPSSSSAESEETPKPAKSTRLASPAADLPPGLLHPSFDPNSIFPHGIYRSKRLTYRQHVDQYPEYVRREMERQGENLYSSARHWQDLFALFRVVYCMSETTSSAPPANPATPDDGTPDEDNDVEVIGTSLPLGKTPFDFRNKTEVVCMGESAKPKSEPRRPLEPSPKRLKLDEVGVYGRIADDHEPRRRSKRERAVHLADSDYVYEYDKGYNSS